MAAGYIAAADTADSARVGIGSVAVDIVPADTAAGDTGSATAGTAGSAGTGVGVGFAGTDPAQNRGPLHRLPLKKPLRRWKLIYVFAYRSSASKNAYSKDAGTYVVDTDALGRPD